VSWLERALELFDLEASLGEPRWAAGGWRCYSGRDDEGATLTLLPPEGPGLRYVVAGVDPEALG
jgi:hypothetical protein